MLQLTARGAHLCSGSWSQALLPLASGYLFSFRSRLPPPVTWAAPYQQCSHGTAGRGGTTGPAGRASHPPALCSEAPGPGSNWGTGPDLEPKGPGGSMAPADTADSREQAQSSQAPNSVPGSSEEEMKVICHVSLMRLFPLLCVSHFSHSLNHSPGVVSQS